MIIVYSGAIQSGANTDFPFADQSTLFFILRSVFLSWQKHSQTIFTIQIPIETLAASIFIINFFCKNMAAGNFYHDRKSALKGFFIGSLRGTV